MFLRERRRLGGPAGGGGAAAAGSAAARAAVLAALSPLLPDADPAYVEQQLAYYDLGEPPDRVAARVARKVFELNAGEYPRARGGPGSTTAKNDALEALADAFPDADPAFLRQRVLADQHDTVFRAADALLALQRPGEAGYPVRLKPGEPLAAKDRFRSPHYARGCFTRLCNDFPDRWKSTVRAVMAECNDDYLESHARLAAMGRPGWIPTLISKVFQRRPSSDPAAFDVDLLRDVDELARRRAEEAARADAAVAAQINEREYRESGQAIPCGCCFDDFAFEDMAACPAGHLFCRPCVGRYASEAVFGQAGGTAAADAGGLQCMDGSEGGRCPEFFDDEVVELCAGADVHSKWREKLAVAELQKAGLPYVKCPWCPYAEVDGLAEDRLRGVRPPPPEVGPIDARALFFWTCISALLSPVAPLVAGTIFFSVVVPPLIALPLLRILPFDPDHPVPRFLRLLLPPPRPPGPPPARLFTCLNPRCSRRSCLVCGREWGTLHRCRGDHAGSLRQYVEQAMTLALVRTCPRCALQFQKADGCNKMTCPGCGYVLCYVCRKEIGQEGYGHFCQHFRPLPGPCGECNRCDLYKVEEDSRAVREAGRRARERWLMEHPDAAVGADDVEVP
ncbi:hypothetical protein DFJ74DRAFT_763876 [Hyaloraphidium curvatum]|nr:hypothetical protein DFJ74DRAFT_763876 [Hyaloraphidium curvatum]